ncbi:hypothetical protein [Kitasatospora sp. NPDC047058]|uniref:hypothetical protein n=1 Tax=Kitasatospora sp. NPDC047058 TaxID=3155620 RepID=UPI0033DD392B
MTLREDTEQDLRHERDRQYRPAERHGRHGRPRPFGGRLRLPTLKFSGAAMAMSTVVGISIATTLLLNEQQGVGRRAGVARVGTTPPADPGLTDRTDAAADASPGPAAPPPAGRSGSRPTATASPSADAPHPPAADGPAPRTGDHRGPGTGDPGTTGSAPSPAADAPSAPATEPLGPPRGGHEAVTPAPTTAPATTATTTPPAGTAPTGTGAPAGSEPPAGHRPNGPQPFVPTGPGSPPPPDVLTTGGDKDGLPDQGTGQADVGTGQGSTQGKRPAGTDTGAGDPAGDEAADHALSGAAVVQPLGRDGTRHVLTLTVAEPVTALQAEFRLAPGALAPGTGTAWTDLAGIVITAHQERGTLVYRFTTPDGTDVRPGRYTFAAARRPPPRARPRPPAAPRPPASRRRRPEAPPPPSPPRRRCPPPPAPCPP